MLYALVKNDGPSHAVELLPQAKKSSQRRYGKASTEPSLLT